jgi:hypothetical protein
LLGIAAGSVNTPTLDGFVAYAEYLARSDDCRWRVRYCNICKEFFVVEKARGRRDRTCGKEDCIKKWEKLRDLGIGWESAEIITPP